MKQCQHWQTGEQGVKPSCQNINQYNHEVIENVKIKYYPTLTLTIKLYIIFCLKPILGPLRFLNCDIIFMSINDFSPQNDLFISITRVKLISELLNDVDGI